MNRIYSLVWSAARGAFIVTSETSKSRGKAGGSAIRVTLGGVVLGALLLTGTQGVYAACTTTAANEALSVALGSGCTYIGSTYAGANITNDDNITSAGTATNLLGSVIGSRNSGYATVYLTDGTPSSLNTLTNNGTLTNNSTDTTTGIGIKALLVQGSASIFNNGTLLQHSNAVGANQIRTAILYMPTANTDVLNLTNTGTITGDSSGLYVNGNGITTITNGSASNHTATISATSSIENNAIFLFTGSKGSIDNYGIIQGTNPLPSLGNNRRGVYNKGEITSFKNEIQAQVIGGITNSNIFGTLENSGSIDTILNTSTFTSVTNNTGATIGSINSFGTLGTVLQSVSNAGSITTLVSGAGAAGADGSILYDLSNSGTIGTLTNNSTIAKSNLAAAIYNTGTITTLTNTSGARSTSIDSIQVANRGLISSLNNGSYSTTVSNAIGQVDIFTGGTITTLNNVGSGAITSISNSGTLTSLANNYTGTIGNISNSGTLSKFINGHTSNLQVNSANYIQAYSGVLPINYYMVINNSSTTTNLYSQMAVTSGTGSLTFGINTSSTGLANIATGAVFTDVLSGVTLANLNTNSVASTISGYQTVAFVDSGSNGISGTLGTGTGLRNWGLRTNNNGGFDLCFDSCSALIAIPNIVNSNDRTSQNTGGFNLMTNVGQGNFKNKFDGGTLRVDAASTGAAFSITSNKGYIDQYGSSATFSGTISDDVIGTAGRLIITNTHGASGGVALTNTANSYSGGTEVQAGATLEITSAAALGTGGLDLVGSSTVPATLKTTTDMTISAPITVAGDPVFTVASGTTLTISNPITDGASPGDVVADGGGTLLLTAANTYTGASTINTGSTLALGTSGSIATTSGLTNNGIFDLTNAASIVSLTGSGSTPISNFVQSSTGTLKMVASPTTFQRLNITGTATLGGTLGLTASTGSYTAGHYVLINATGGVSGTFATFNNNLSTVAPSLQYTLGYDANNVYLDLTASSSSSNSSNSSSSASPTAADTQSALLYSAAALRGVFNQQSALVSNSMNYDCTLFAENDMCVSGGGRFLTTNSITGEQTSTLLIAAYRAKPTLRLGAFVDENVPAVNTSGINLEKSPMYGLFGVWNENPDAMGWEARLSASWAKQNITQIRSVVGTSEAGTGTSSLSSKAVSGVLSYAVQMSDDGWVASPYLGVRQSKVTRGGYTELNTITSALTYSDLTQDITSTLTGLRVSKKFNNDFSMMASVGAERSSSTKVSTLDATGVTGLTATDFTANYAKTRPVASIGASYEFAKDQRISFTAMYRKEAFQSTVSTTGLLMYQVGL
jgi:hypothetical protein